MARSKRRNKARFRWTKELIILLSVLTIMVVTTIILSIPSEKEALYKKYNSNQSSTVLTEDNVYKEISYSNLLKKINNDEYTYVYYGTKENTTFIQNLETINTIAKLVKVETVYIYESTWATSLDLEDEDEGKANQDKLIVRETALKDVDLLTIPSLWIYKNGELVFDSAKILEDPYTSTDWGFVIQQAFANPEKKPSI